VNEAYGSSKCYLVNYGREPAEGAACAADSETKAVESGPEEAAAEHPPASLDEIAHTFQALNLRGRIADDPDADDPQRALEIAAMALIDLISAYENGVEVPPALISTAIVFTPGSGEPLSPALVGISASALHCDVLIRVSLVGSGG
jgi:hypothetical protein